MVRPVTCTPICTWSRLKMSKDMITKSYPSKRICLRCDGVPRYIRTRSGRPSACVTLASHLFQPVIRIGGTITSVRSVPFNIRYRAQAVDGQKLAGDRAGCRPLGEVMLLHLVARFPALGQLRS